MPISEQDPASSSPVNSRYYPVDMVQPLLSTWPEWRRRESTIPTLPADALVLELLETAYHASFTADEQRRTRLVVVVCAPQEASDTIVFDEPRPFSVHELMRLAPVSDPAKVAIGVAVFDGSLKIWGLCSDAFMQLTVSIYAPGWIEVGRNEHVFVALRGGQLAGGRTTDESSAVIQFLSVANEALWQGIEFPGGSWSPQVIVFPSHLMGLASTIAKAGHGGAILLVPETYRRDELSRFVRIKYACDDNSIWNDLVEAVRLYDGPTMEDPVARERAQGHDHKVEYQLSRIAKLASVDGAIVVTDRLRLLGFGGEVIATTPVDTVVASDGSVRMVDDFGTRHRSAFRFCAADPSFMAIVCSQDGGVKYVSQRDGNIRLVQA